VGATYANLSVSEMLLATHGIEQSFLPCALNFTSSTHRALLVVKRGREGSGEPKGKIYRSEDAGAFDGKILESGSNWQRPSSSELNEASTQHST